MNDSTSRITTLDGLRGVAIFSVIIFHTYSRWSEYIPWTTGSKEFPLFKYGYLGVELFFLISGFVIYLTLNKCISYREFIFRRWIRLFPAMLIVTILVLASSTLLYERPAGKPNLIDVFPGLFFIEPSFFTKTFGAETSALEWSFWTLFIEVKFYLLFGGLYFLSRKRALFILSLIFMSGFVYKLVIHFCPSLQIKYFESILFDILSINYFGWFIIGALFYLAYLEKNKNYIFLSILLLPPTIIQTTCQDVAEAAAGLVVYLIFLLSIVNHNFSKIIACRIFVFIGFISYPLYLIHENALVSLTIKTHKHYSAMPNMLTPLPGLLLIILLAFLVAKYIEPFVKKCILAFIRRGLNCQV